MPKLHRHAHNMYVAMYPQTLRYVLDLVLSNWRREFAGFCIGGDLHRQGDLRVSSYCVTGTLTFVGKSSKLIEPIERI